MNSDRRKYLELSTKEQKVGNTEDSEIPRKDTEKGNIGPTEVPGEGGKKWSRGNI